MIKTSQKKGVTSQPACLITPEFTHGTPHGGARVKGEWWPGKPSQHHGSQVGLGGTSEVSLLLCGQKESLYEFPHL